VPRSKIERNRINRLLRANGLGSLEERGTLMQLAYLVRDHAHLRDLLNACEPSERVAMYEAIQPNLRFPAKPLDVYLAEMQELAARKQLPVIEPNGTLTPYRPPEIRTQAAEEKASSDLLAEANEVVAAATARKALKVVCAHCTRAAVFHGFFSDDCVKAAREAGWRYDAEHHAEVCPECV